MLYDTDADNKAHVTSLATSEQTRSREVRVILLKHQCWFNPFQGLPLLLPDQWLRVFRTWSCIPGPRPLSQSSNHYNRSSGRWSDLRTRHSISQTTQYQRRPAIRYWSYSGSLSVYEGVRKCRYLRSYRPVRPNFHCYQLRSPLLEYCLVRLLDRYNWL